MSPAGPALLCPTLVARAEPLAALVNALDGAFAGHGRTTLVVGEAGIGKTALLRRFVEVARDRGARVAVGECIEIEAKRPLGPFIEVLDELTRSGILRHGMARPDLEGGQVDDEKRYRVYLSFAALFSQLGRAAPLLVVVEDLHWADEATLELLGYLARKLRDGRVLLVGTYRSDELHRQHPLRPLLAELARARLADEIVVEPLSPADLSKFLRETLRLDRDPSPGFRHAIHERCEGNPLFVEEVLKALQQSGDLEFRDGQWRLTTEMPQLVLPDSIRDAVQARLRPLTPRARRVLQVAAVIGQSFGLDRLRDVVRITEEELARDLEAAVTAQIVIASGGSTDRFAFRHALTRESIIAELLEPERRELHRAVGLGIEQTPDAPAARAEELAYHFDEARDADRAFRYRVIAADEARRSASFARAAGHLERALALAPMGKSVATVYLSLADAAYLAGDPTRAIRASDEGYRAYIADGDTLQAGAALCRLARYRWQLGEPTGSATALEAVQLLEPLGQTAALAAAYAEVARATFFLNDDVHAARDWATRAIDLARATGAVGVEADALATLGPALMYEDQERAAGLLREAIELATQVELATVVVRAYLNLISIALWSSGSSLDPRRLFGEALAYVERSGFRSAAFQYLRALYALADGHFDAVLALAADTPGETTFGRMLELHAALIVRIARDGPEGTDTVIPPPLARALGAPTLRNDAAARAKLKLLGGDLQGVLAEADALGDDIEPQRPRAHYSTELVVAAVHAAHVLGDATAVERWSARAEAWASSGRLGEIAARYAAAEASADRGDDRHAAELFGLTADELHEQLSPVLETTTRLRRVEMLMRFDTAAANAEFTRVVAFWRSGKATWYVGQLERWAATHQTQFPQAERTPTPTHTLTEREREVARLVAEGLSNREIAERLFVSERTAEGHVQRILSKLNFRSRTQIAVWDAEIRFGAGRR